MYTLRPATLADEPFLRHLYRETEAELRVLPAPVREQLLPMQFRARQFSWAAAYPGVQDELLLSDGRDAGRLLVARTSSGLRVVDIAVLPEFQHQGIATFALREVQARARAAGMGVGLQVASHNPARRLYVRLGFVPIDANEMSVEMCWPAKDAEVAG